MYLCEIIKEESSSWGQISREAFLWMGDELVLFLRSVSELAIKELVSGRGLTAQYHHSYYV
jgi:hypothetical protein